ncbi:MAG: hypothetical protein U0821_16250 [Chloroflexota bacterium]
MPESSGLEAINGPALDWLLRSLQSRRTVSKRVAERVDLPLGALSALLPRDIDVRSVVDFEHGGQFSRAGPDSAEESERRHAFENAEHSMVLDLARRTRAASLLAEDELLPSTDPPRCDGLCVLMHADSTRIHVASVGALGTRDAWRRFVAHSSGGYPRNAFLTAYPPEELLARANDTDAHGLVAAVGESMLAILVGAFDDESWVVWEQNRQSGASEASTSR